MQGQGAFSGVLRFAVAVTWLGPSLVGDKDLLVAVGCFHDGGVKGEVCRIQSDTSHTQHAREAQGGTGLGATRKPTNIRP